MTFADNSWADIQAAAKAGLASSYWEVGDSKAVTLNGGVGNLTFSNETYYAFILGFDHNSLYEGTKKLHMCLGKNASGTQIVFCDSNYGNTASSGFIMSNPHSTPVGWETSYMRTTICSQMQNALPSDLKTILGTCIKYSKNGTSNNHVESEITSTTESVFIMSQYEATGESAGIDSFEPNKQQQYAYFVNGNSLVFYRSDLEVYTAAIWWTRSRKVAVGAISNTDFRTITS